MARSLALGVTLAVLTAHLLLLQTLASLWEPPTPLKAMAMPFFTRELSHSTPPQPPTALDVKKEARAHTKSSFSAIDSIANSLEASVPSMPSLTQVATAQDSEASPSTPDGSPSPDAVGKKKDPPPLPMPPQDDWPVDTRLSYTLTGYYRGPISGEGRVQWQRQGTAYQVRVELDLSNVTIFTMTSQGQAAPDGLTPSAYEEKRLGTKPLQVTMERQGIRLNNGQRIERPELAQDTASQFVELGHRFATGRAPLQVGASVQLWLARPNAAAEWTYDIVALDTIQSIRLGAIEAYHLKPRPLDNPNGPIAAEMWFAPSLQYLPVRIKITMNAETWVDLIVDKIEQVAPSPMPATTDPAPSVAPALKAGG